jgi:hypothetical protein
MSLKRIDAANSSVKRVMPNHPVQINAFSVAILQYNLAAIYGWLTPYVTEGNEIYWVSSVG